MSEMLIQLLTDPENQPHQFVGDADGLRKLLDAYLSSIKSKESAAGQAVEGQTTGQPDEPGNPEPTMSAEEAREACARIARAHIGQAEKERRRKGFKLNDEVQAEERGETIAAEIIELNIRSLDLSRKEK